MNKSAVPIDQLTTRELQSTFIESIQPRIVTHARIHFRSIPCRDRRQDCIAEVIALCWRWFCELARRGKDPRQFVSMLADFGVRAVKSCRRLCGQLSAKDALSERAQRLHGFHTQPLARTTQRSHQSLHGSVNGQRQLDDYEDHLHDHRHWPVPDRAGFKVDFPQFVMSLSRRDRRLLYFLAQGHSGKAAARKFRLSPSRVTQLRKSWCRAYQVMQGEASLV